MFVSINIAKLQKVFGILLFYLIIVGSIW